MNQPIFLSILKIILVMIRGYRPGHFTWTRRPDSKPTRKNPVRVGTDPIKLPYRVLLQRTRGSWTRPDPNRKPDGYPN